jgi:hypothetical protein
VIGKIKDLAAHIVSSFFIFGYNVLTDADYIVLIGKME